MLNEWVGMGRLTRSPELKNTQSGVSMASFTIACDRDFKNKSDERETDFIDVVAWRAKADFVSKYFHKGQLVVVKGRWQMNDYTDKDGNKRRSWSVVAEDVYFADSKRTGDAAPEPAPGEFADITDQDDGELPF